MSPRTKLPECFLAEGHLDKQRSHNSGSLKHFYERLNEGDELSSGTPPAFPATGNELFVLKEFPKLRRKGFSGSGPGMRSC